MVHHDSVIVFVSEAKRLLQLGNIPKAITALEGMLEMAEKEKLRLSPPTDTLKLLYMEQMSLRTT